MQKQISSKKIMIIICAAAVVIVVAVVMLLSGKEEYFRSVLVYELDGSAVIERADIGTIDAAENLYLESGDRVSVKEDSMMRMKLDDDKYITAEADTVFSLEAKGSEQDSKTRINLEQGAITNEIQNPLSKDSIYETAAPNSIMAVRGTVYRAQLYDDGEGGQDMRLCCFEGTVAATPVLPDGTLGEEVLVHEGSELTVYSDGTADEPKDIDFSSLPQQAIETLTDLVNNGTDIAGITKEELADILVSYGNIENTDIEADKLKEESDNIDNAEDMQEVPGSDEADTADSEKDKQKSQDGDKKETGKQSANRPQTDKKKENSKNDAKDPNTQKPQTPSNKSGNTPDNSGGSDSDNGSSGDSQNNTPDNGSGNKPGKPAKKVTYTVTYKYQGSVFATQSVKKNDKATAPTLAPAASGSWDFDFSTKITADTTIEWK